MTFENAVVAVTLDPATGGFASIRDKRIGHEYVAAPDRALLWRLIAPEGDRHFVHIDASMPAIQVSGSTATLAYVQPGASATVTLTLVDDAIEARLKVTNTGAANIEEVMFPWVRGLGPFPGAKFVWPHFWGRKMDDPFGKDFGGDHHTWNEWTQKKDARYPGHMASPWCDLGNEQHGIALEGRHRDFSIMDFNIHKIVEKDRDPVRRTLDAVTVHPRRIKPGESWESPTVRMLVHQGDWHVPARQRREWLETWIAKPQRPAKFAEAIGWHFYFMKHQDGLEVNTYADLPAMAEASLKAGCPYLLVFGWQTGGHDNNYMYRYVPNEAWGGEAALREALEKVRAMGVEVMPFYNGTLANVEMPEHKEFGHRWEAKTREGHPYYAGDWARHNFEAITRNRAMLHHEIAPCAEHRAYFLESIRRIVQQYGFGNTQLDQISEKMLVDYNEDHVETTPDRVYVDGLAKLLPEVRRLVREANEQGVVISECLNEFTGQWCDSSWDWNILLPFPEPILYTMPWVFASHEVDALEYAEANSAFAYKMHLDMKIDGGDAPIDKYPAFADHVRRNAELRKKVAPYYVYADFCDQDGIQCEASDHIITKVYRNPVTKKTGIVLAETQNKAGEQRLRFTRMAGLKAMKLESNSGRSTNLAWSEELAIALAPYEVVVLCLDEASEAGQN